MRIGQLCYSLLIRLFKVKTKRRAAKDGQVWAKLGPAVLKTFFKSVATPLCLEKFKPVNFLTNCLTVDVKKIWASCL